MDFVTNDRNTTPPVRRRSRGLLWKIALLVLLVFGMYFYWKYVFTYSSGKRYGLLQKFSEKGTLFKTYEGEMILSSVRSNTNIALASEKFFFTVADKGMADQLSDLQGRYVTVHYRQKNGTLPWRGDSPFIVDSVRVDTLEQHRY